MAMAEVSITLNGRVFRLSCGPGEESRLQDLSRIVNAKLETLIAEYGQVGDDRLLLLSALMIADDMLEARSRVEALERQHEAVRQPAPREE